MVKDWVSACVAMVITMCALAAAGEEKQITDVRELAGTWHRLER
jgi:hypothetical protein